MMSDKKSSESTQAGFTPVTVEAFQAGKPLTGSSRILRDHCAVLYNTVQQWNDHVIKGFVIIKEIADMYQQDIPVVFSDDFETCTSPFESEFNTGLQNLSEKLTEEIESMKTQQNILEDTTDKIKAVCSLMAQERRRVSESTEDPEDYVPFMSWPLSRFYDEAEKLASKYSKETHIKDLIAAEISRLTNKDIVLFFIICWKYQPYTGCKDILESIVIECGLKT